MSSCLDAALAYACEGLAVFPLAPNTKIPLTEHGFKDAVTDEKQIREWWGRNPDANIGIATGAMSGGLVVVDLDVKGGKDGISTFQNWIDKNHLFIPDTPKAKTWSGGEHYLFKSSVPTPCKTDWLDGVDVRADGGYIVAPPSEINGEFYEWVVSLEDSDILDDDRDEDVYTLLEEIRSDNRPQQQEITSGPGFVLPDVIPQGKRNGTITSYVGSLQRNGFGDFEIFDKAKEANTRLCKPPLSDKELEGIVRSVLRYEKGGSQQKQPEQKAVTEDDLVMQTVDEIQEEEQQWLVHGYIPSGCVTLLCSDGGLGKTTLWCSIIADLASGRPTILDRIDEYPYEISELKTMYFSKEDSTATVLKPRLRENNANMRNILTIDINDERINRIYFGSELLEKLIDKYKPSICVFDTLQAFLPAKTNISDRKSVRDALNPLNQLGAKYGTAFLLIMHSNKSSNYGRQRMADSSDIWDISRSALMIGRTKDYEIMYMSHEKTNYGKPQPTILFSIGDNGLEFRGTTNKKDRDFILEQQQVVASSPKKQEAMEFIIEQLTENHGRMTIGELEVIAKSLSITPSTLQEARAQLKVDRKVKMESTGFGANKQHFLVLLGNNPK